jgi:hypothetical protein
MTENPHLNGRDEVLKRMSKTPPKPHAALKVKKKTSRAARTRAKAQSQTAARITGR